MSSILKDSILIALRNGWRLHEYLPGRCEMFSPSVKEGEWTKQGITRVDEGAVAQMLDEGLLIWSETDREYRLSPGGES